MSSHSRWSPGRIIVLGFAGVILTGMFLLLMPFSRQPGATVRAVDALFTSTSAVCVTGLISIDTAEHFNVFGRTVVALLIQIGGLGVTSIGVTFILLAGGRVGLRERVLVKEALNLHSMNGIVKLVKSILFMTLFFEGIGAVLSFLVFSQHYAPLDALGISLFHSVAAFNNSGFDILGGLTGLIPYRNNVLLNLTTCALIIFGGLGFCVIRELKEKKRLHTCSVNTKIVVGMTAFLLIAGTVLLKLTENITWLGAFMQSTSARTAGFSTYPIGKFTNAGLFVLIILMFIGASPGSTGGGIKTTTAFTIFRSLRSTATNRECTVLQRKIPDESISTAFSLAAMAVVAVCVCTFALCIFEPQFSLMQILFEVVSAFGTVGLSTGITPNLTDASKITLSAMMFFGRLGPLTMACIWSYRPTSNVTYGEEKITIG